MNKFMYFNETVRNAFANDEAQYMNFNKLLVDVAFGKQEVSKEEANAKIREKLRAAIGVGENATNVEIRRAVRRNQVEIYELLEDTIQTLLVTGWQNNPFFRDYVDVRNLALGDANSFYIEDESVLHVSKIAAGHHDIFLTISVRIK